MDPNVENAPIVKKIIYAGVEGTHFKDGTKVFFHFQTRLCNADRTLIDDSRKIGPGEPLELVLGKKFKLEVWEVILQKMAIKEVAQFTVDKSLVTQYPFVSKTLRDKYNTKSEPRGHCCAMTLQTHGFGYEDLNELLTHRQNLEFTMEIVNVIQPEDYQKETWQMNEVEKMSRVPILKEEGNNNFRNKDIAKAEQKYSEALGILEQLMLKEKPHDDEWNALEKQKVPLLLNYSQCKLSKGEFYPVIEHCSTVLKIEPDNVKALFRRAKAHVGAWNPREARGDFERAMELDPDLTKAIKQELHQLDLMMKKKDLEDAEKLKNLF